MALVPPPEPPTKPPPFDDAAEESVSDEFEITLTSWLAVSWAPESMAIELLSVRVTSEVALLTEISPPASLLETARPNMKEWVVITMLAPVRLADPTSFLRVTIAFELEVALSTLMMPPPPPEAKAVTIMSPAPADPAPELLPMPKNCWVPEDALVRSITSFWAPSPGLPRAMSPSRTNRCTLSPNQVVIGIADPPGLSESWKWWLVEPSTRLTT